MPLSNLPEILAAQAEGWTVMGIRFDNEPDGARTALLLTTLTFDFVTYWRLHRYHEGQHLTPITGVDVDMQAIYASCTLPNEETP